MTQYRGKRGMRPGFTLVEGLVFLFLFALITAVFFQTFAYGTALIQQSKNRLGAVALANQKMEIVRSLDYDNIGTVSGIPNGDIAQDEDVQVNNSQYHVHTFIQYRDDPYDGTLGGSPNDVIPNDYKRVRIEVSWGGGSESEKVALFSTFTPSGVEQATGGGILSINILNASGTGVPGATVQVVNNTVVPSVNVTASTDASGNLFLIGAPASVKKYHIIFSKSGYFGSSSYAPYPTTSFVPTDVDASVVNGVVNQSTFVMDREATMHLKTKDAFGSDLPNINYHIMGGRQLGTDFGTGTPVYDLNENAATDGSAEKDYADRSYGTYTWTLDPSETGYEFIRLSPDVPTGPNDISMLPNESKDVDMILADKTIPAALFTVSDNATGNPVIGASVHLTNAGLAYDETVATSMYGKAYFPVATATGLAAGTYDYQITLSGYATKNGTVTIGAALQKMSIAL